MTSHSDIEKEIALIEDAFHPRGRCTECGGGEAYWKHNPGDPMLGHHAFQAPEPKICREWLGKDRGDCGKPATVRITFRGITAGGGSVYKCDRHARRFRADSRIEIEVLA